MLTVLDADGVVPSGLLDGAFHWLGNYDGCLRAKATGTEMSAIGPGGEVFIHDFDANYFRVYFRYVFQIGMSVGVCLPSLCTSDDVTHMLGGRPTTETLRRHIS